MKQKNQKQEQEDGTIPTAGEIFADGAILDLVYDPAEEDAPQLLLWKDGSQLIGPRIEHEQHVYTPITIEPTLWHSVRLPRRPIACESPRLIVTDLVEILARFTGLMDGGARLLAHIGVASWFSECFERAPMAVVTGPPTSAIRPLMQLLSCVCRRPLTVFNLSASRLAALPMRLRPTLLIDQQTLPKSALEFLQASSSGSSRFPSGGRLLDLSCAKIIFTGNDPASPALADHALVIPLPPLCLDVEPLNDRSLAEIAEFFQPRLLSYRLHNVAAVHSSKFDAPQFSPATRELARSLGACIIDDPELQQGVVSLLEEQEAEARTALGTSLEATVVEALLFYCHQAKKQEIYAAEIAEVATAIMWSRKEPYQFSPKQAGCVLKSLGFRTTRLGSAGRGTLLLDAMRRRVHELAREFGVPTLRSGNNNCPHCMKVSGPQGEHGSGEKAAE